MTSQQPSAARTTYDCDGVSSLVAVCLSCPMSVAERSAREVCDRSVNCSCDHSIREPFRKASKIMENSKDFFDFVPSTQVQQHLAATTAGEDIFSSVNSADNNETSANYPNSCAADNHPRIKVEPSEDFTIKMEDEKDELGPIPDNGPGGQNAAATFRSRCYTWPRHYLEGHWIKLKSYCLLNNFMRKMFILNVA